MTRDRPARRYTRQRDAVASAIRRAAGPLTVPEIHARARRRLRGGSLGIATVYRTVNLLLQRQAIHTVILADGQARYESADLDHHHHFRCRLCHTVFDLSGCLLELPGAAGRPEIPVRLPAGFRVEDHELTLYGTCPRCSRPRRRARR